MTTLSRWSEPPPAARDALRAAARGELGAASHALALVPAALRRSWSLAVAAQARLVASTAATDWQELEAAAGGDPPSRTAALFAAAARAREALVALDVPSFARACAIARTVTAEAPTAALMLDALAAWEALLAGRASAALAAAESVRERATTSSDGALVVESMVVRALAADDAADARASARRAARMAQAEALPAVELLAHTVLARVRRWSATPHLAARILAALARVAPPTWSPWLAWERAFALGDAPPVEAATGPAVAIETMLAAAAAGDREAFDAAKAQVEAAVRGWHALTVEAAALADAVDPRADTAASHPALARWCSGEAALAPFGIQGAVLGGDRGPLPASGVVFVAAGAPTPVRRFLRPGLGLIAPAGAATLMAQTHRKQGRLDSAVAALALAGSEGQDPAAFFRTVYGFAYVPELHKGVLDVLIHRMRDRLADRASIERVGPRFALIPRSLLVVPDPRCAPTVDDRILGLLAARRAATAREAAQSLGVPLRTVQTALAELVADGALRAQGQGNRTEYAVEDTVFSETTSSSVKPR